MCHLEPFKGVSKFKMMKVGNSTLGWTLNEFFWEQLGKDNGHETMRIAWKVTKK